jgi:hypothetical protein
MVRIASTSISSKVTPSATDRENNLSLPERSAVRLLLEEGMHNTMLGTVNHGTAVF